MTPINFFRLAMGLGIIFLNSCQETGPSESSNDQILGNLTQKLVYISDKAAGFDIFKIDLDGQNEQNLTNLPGWEWYPQFVESQQIILFNRQDTLGQFTLKAISLDGQEKEFDSHNLPGFDISPDGRWVCYTRQDDPSTQILIAPLNALKDSLQITANDFYNGRPKWSRDGRKLAYISDRTGTNEIYIYDLAQQSTIQLTDNEVREKYMSWSPNNDQLITSMNRDTLPNDLFLIDLSTKTVTQLTNTSINESEIAWSPKGNLLAYHAKVDGKDDIFLLHLQSKEITKVTDGSAYYGEPTWILESSEEE